MTFYVNRVNGLSDWDNDCIGLFDGNKWKGEGNLCGYYACEYYLNTTLIAYGIQKGHRSSYNPKLPFDGGFKVVNKHYNKIMIGSGFWESKFNADSINEAIEIFKSQSW